MISCDYYHYRVIIYEIESSVCHTRLFLTHAIQTFSITPELFKAQKSKFFVFHNLFLFNKTICLQSMFVAWGLTSFTFSAGGKENTSHWS